jgi:hypothetical protein
MSKPYSIQFLERMAECYFRNIDLPPVNGKMQEDPMVLTLSYRNGYLRLPIGANIYNALHQALEEDARDGGTVYLEEDETETLSETRIRTSGSIAGLNSPTRDSFAFVLDTKTQDVILDVMSSLFLEDAQSPVLTEPTQDQKNIMQTLYDDIIGVHMTDMNTEHEPDSDEEIPAPDPVKSVRFTKDELLLIGCSMYNDWLDPKAEASREDMRIAESITKKIDAIN